MTNQQIFDKVCEHLMKQGKAAKTPEGACLYRTVEGLKCAVGCLIPESLYSPDMEGKAVFEEALKMPLLAEGCYSEDLLGSLQSLHDNHEECSWKRGLSLIAEKHSLKAPSCIS